MCQWPVFSDKTKRITARQWETDNRIIRSCLKGFPSNPSSRVSKLLAPQEFGQGLAICISQHSAMLGLFRPDPARLRVLKDEPPWRFFHNARPSSLPVAEQRRWLKGVTIGNFRCTEVVKSVNGISKPRVVLCCLWRTSSEHKDRFERTSSIGSFPFMQHAATTSPRLVQMVLFVAVAWSGVVVVGKTTLADQLGFSQPGESVAFQSWRSLRHVLRGFSLSRLFSGNTYLALPHLVQDVLSNKAADQAKLFSLLVIVILCLSGVNSRQEAASNGDPISKACGNN
ncbi:hypothetical protein RRG08_041935 [Elysia crispata]|uniref:Uncharacterized protein n=1 Tax=Elysia crispata TaxID=231223 RepID=A0AAE0XXZ5_9GAST|nr:hypothetical protein RRG08_041935 [Elysia crispata]